MTRDAEKTCPQCLLPTMRDWEELSDEERLLAKRLAMSAEYTKEERKKHRFCPRCWYEEPRERRGMIT